MSNYWNTFLNIAELLNKYIWAFVAVLIIAGVFAVIFIVSFIKENSKTGEDVLTFIFRLFGSTSVILSVGGSLVFLPDWGAFFSSLLTNFLNGDLMTLIWFNIVLCWIGTLIVKAVFGIAEASTKSIINVKNGTNTTGTPSKPSSYNILEEANEALKETKNVKETPNVPNVPDVPDKTPKTKKDKSSKQSRGLGEGIGKGVATFSENLPQALRSEMITSKVDFKRYTYSTMSTLVITVIYFTIFLVALFDGDPLWWSKLLYSIIVIVFGITNAYRSFNSLSDGKEGSGDFMDYYNKASEASKKCLIEKAQLESICGGKSKSNLKEENDPEAMYEHNIQRMPKKKAEEIRDEMYREQRDQLFSNFRIKKINSKEKFKTFQVQGMTKKMCNGNNYWDKNLKMCFPKEMKMNIKKMKKM